MKKIDSFKGEYYFLSNFYPCKIEYRGIIYPSVEHGFQACKSLERSDRIRISKLKSATAAKRAGKKLKLRVGWEKMRKVVMYIFLSLKFEDSKLRAKLLATGDAELIEGNTWGDTYWGVCNGVGKNRLGKLLMKIRKDLK